MINKLEHYCIQIPVLSFNFAGNDINLIKKEIAKCLVLYNSVHKNTTYMSDPFEYYCNQILVLGYISEKKVNNSTQK